MKLNISELQKNPGAREKFAFILEELPESSELSFCKPASVEGEVVNTGQGLELNAHVQTAVSGKCDRCLDEVCIPLEFDISEEYVRLSELEEDEDSGAAMVLTYNEDWLDLAEAVKEHLILNLPMRTVCDPDCPGLCPSCGKKHKEGSCQCHQQDVDPRLAILAKLKAND